MSERKFDTRIKIHLGGLVIKGGLEDIDPALLYGALSDVRKSLRDPDKGSRLTEKWTKAGIDAGVPSHPAGVRDMLSKAD